MENEIIKKTIDSFISTNEIENYQNQNNVSVKILLDEYSLEKSEMIIERLPQDVNIRAEKYFLKNELGLFTLRSYFSEEIQRKIKFRVLSFEYDENPIDKYIYRSSYVENLQSAVTLIKNNDYEIKKKLIIRDSKIYHFYEIVSDRCLSEKELRLIFYILSFMTASLFGYIYKKKKSENVIIVNKYSKCNNLSIYGSGLMFSLDFIQIYDIITNNDLNETFCNITFLYCRFTTAEDKINQFLNGCNLLEFLIESYIFNPSHDFESCWDRQGSYSIKLYSVVNHLFSSDELKYFESMFVDYPNSIEDSNYKNKSNKKNITFFFVQLRNNLVHNGKSFEIEDWPDLSNSLFVINEILRILISKFDKITPKYKETTGIKAKDMKDIIKNRKKIFNSN